jgi:hypothetical protein
MHFIIVKNQRKINYMIVFHDYFICSKASCTKAEQNSNRLEIFFLTATQAFCDIDSAFGKLLCIVVGCSLNMFLEYHPSARISYYYILI